MIRNYLLMKHVKSAIRRLWSAIAASIAGAGKWYADASPQKSNECSTQTEKSKAMEKHLSAMSKRRGIMDLVEQYEEECTVLLPPEYDNAIRGAYDSDGRLVAVYSRDEVISLIQEGSEPEMSHWDAVEYFEFNIESSYVGHPMPIYIIDLE